MKNTFVYYPDNQNQHETTCLHLIASLYGNEQPIEKLSEKFQSSKQGQPLIRISKVAEEIGFHTIIAILSFQEFIKVPLPCIALFEENQYIVVKQIKKHKNNADILTIDPYSGKITYSQEEFCNKWLNVKAGCNNEGVLLLMNPKFDFYYQNKKRKRFENLHYHLCNLKYHKNNLFS